MKKYAFNPITFKLFIKSLFDKWDLDQNGLIDVHEFPGMIGELFSFLGQPPPTLQDMFFLMWTFNKEHNGVITFSEWSDMAYSLFEESSQTN